MSPLEPVAVFAQIAWPPAVPCVFWMTSWTLLSFSLIAAQIQKIPSLMISRSLLNPCCKIFAKTTTYSSLKKFQQDLDLESKCSLLKSIHGGFAVVDHAIFMQGKFSTLLSILATPKNLAVEVNIYAIYSLHKKVHMKCANSSISGTERVMTLKKWRDLHYICLLPLRGEHATLCLFSSASRIFSASISADNLGTPSMGSNLCTRDAQIDYGTRLLCFYLPTIIFSNTKLVV